jgi:hypothetical protein
MRSLVTVFAAPNPVGKPKYIIFKLLTFQSKKNNVIEMWKSEGLVVSMVILYSKTERRCQYTSEVMRVIWKGYDEI